MKYFLLNKQSTVEENVMFTAKIFMNKSVIQSYI